MSPPSQTLLFLLLSFLSLSLIHLTSACEGFTYVDGTTSASPEVTDCTNLINDLNSTEKRYDNWIRRDVPSYHTYATNGTCKWGAQRGHSAKTYIIYYSDAVETISQAIEKFSWFDPVAKTNVVGASGKMTCDDGINGNVGFSWSLY